MIIIKSLIFYLPTLWYPLGNFQQVNGFSWNLTRMSCRWSQFHVLTF